MCFESSQLQPFVTSDEILRHSWLPAYEIVGGLDEINLLSLCVDYFNYLQLYQPKLMEADLNLKMLKA